jgi:outer membrane protein OmpA-like peptidoglycan-associated protein
VTYSSEVLADSPLGYWRLGESAVAMSDSSGNGRHGAYTGPASASATGLVSGDSDGAHSFASGSRGIVPDAAWMDASTFTVMATIKPTAVTGNQTIVARYDGFVSGTFTTSSFTLRLEGNKLSCHIFVGNAPGNAIGVTSLVAGNTYDVAATYDGTTVKVYVNGALDGSASRAGMNNASMPLSVGSTSGTAEPFGGVIDDVAYIGSVLTASDLSTLSTNRTSGTGYATSVLAFSPLAYYRLGDPSYTGPLTSTADSSGNGRNISITGGVTAGLPSLLPSDPSDKSMSFDGSSGRLGPLSYASWMTVSALTVEAVIKTTMGGVGSIIDRDNESNRSFQFRLNAGKLEFITLGGGAGIVTAASPGTVNDGVAHHVAATYDASNIRLYVDGTLVTTQAAVGALSTGVDGFAIAYHLGFGGAQYFNGVIDEAAYYGTALSGTRIAAHASAMTASGTPQSFVGSPAALTVAAPAGAFTAGTTIPAAFTGAPSSLTVTAPLGDVTAGTAVAADFTGAPAALTVVAPLGDVVTSAPVAQDFTGAPSAITIAAPAGGYLLSSGAAEDVTDAVEDAADPIALTIGAAESLTDSVVDAADPIRYAVDQIDAIAEAWAEAYDTLTVTLDPDTLRPQYRLKVVDRAGNTICELADAQIGTATRSLNGRGGLDFSLGKNDPQLASVPQFAEVQLWRGAHLVPGGWFTVVDPQIDEGGDTFDYQCSGLTYYFERRLIGAERPEMLRNGGFEEGSRFWSGGWSPGSNAETPPTFEITSDALEGGKALRIFAADKVASIKRTVESAAVFVPNQATFLSGGEQAIRDQVSDIPNGTHITVEGHTADADGGDGYALSVARAEAAAAVIHAYKPTLVITTVGKGETEPVDPRHTEAAYKKNRRVVILANVVQTKVGHRQFEHQSFTASQPASAREPLEFDIQGQGRIDTFEGPSKDGWMLYADVRKVSDPKHLILNNDHVDVDESTARQAWMGLNLTVKVPADGLDYVVDVRLYPTAGSSSFDQISAKPNLKLAFYDMDPRHIIGGLVAHAQDVTLGKSDLNIQAYGPLSGFLTKGIWEWKEAKPVSEAIDDMVRSLNGPDANIAVTPRRRWLVIHPKQGRDSGFVLAAGDCAGDARIIAFAAGVDGDNVTTQARVQTSWSDGGMVEQFVTLPRADGLTLENVYRADQDTPSSALLEQGRTAVKYGQADVVTRVVMHPDDTTLLMERVTIGDIVTLAIKDGRVDVNSSYRIIQIDLDPNTDQLAYVVAPEV